LCGHEIPSAVGLKSYYQSYKGQNN
jgi:hypothetical protein